MLTTAALARALLVLPVIDGLASSPYATLQAAKVVDPRDGSVASPEPLLTRERMLRH